MSRIIVTGANRGIGYEIARQLAVHGHEVILTARDPEKGKEAQASLAADGLTVDFLELDVGSEMSIQQFVQHFGDRYDSVDGLVNNAGVFLDKNSSLEKVEMSIFRQTIEINFYGPLLLTRGLLPFLRKSKDARIVNLSSGLGALGDMGAGYPSYRVSKAAMNAMTAIFGAELATDGIMTNSVCPGWVQTDMGGAGATRTVDKGAETPVWLLTEDRKRLPNGKFLRDKQVIEW